MTRIKLSPEIPVMLKRMETLDFDRLIKIREKGRRERLCCKSLSTWFAWIVIRKCFCPAEICQWYREYNVNDDHITSLAIHCCKAKGLL